MNDKKLLYVTFSIYVTDSEYYHLQQAVGEAKVTLTVPPGVNCVNVGEVFQYLYQSATIDFVAKAEKKEETKDE